MKQKKQPKVKYRKCTQCDKKFSTDFCFNLHSNVHKSRKNAWFSCHACDRKFSQVAKLLGHRAIHPPPKLKVKKRKKNRKKGETSQVSFSNLGHSLLLSVCLVGSVLNAFTLGLGIFMSLRLPSFFKTDRER